MQIPTRPVEDPGKSSIKLVAKTILLASALTVMNAPLCAQTPTKAPDDNSPPDTQEPTITLSPFTVEGSVDHGYQASSTLAGTRIRLI
jgi:hypothetical protein